MMTFALCALVVLGLPRFVADCHDLSLRWGVHMALRDLDKKMAKLAARSSS